MKNKDFFSTSIKYVIDSYVLKSSILYKLYMLFKSYSKEERKKIIAIFIGIEILFLLLLGKIFGITSLRNGLFGRMAGITYLMFIILNGILLYLLLKRRGKNGIRGIMPLTHRVIAESTEYGSAIMMNYDEEIRDKYTVASIEDTDEQIYGQIPDSPIGQSIVSEKKLSDGTIEECNIIGIGKAGTGKSSTIGIPNILQCIKRGESYVCIDPKAAEIRQDTIYVARELNGYKCYTINVLDPEYSDGWDFLGEVVDHKNRKGRLDPTKLDMFVNVYFPNTAGVGGEQAYYVEGAAAYLKLLISVLTWRRESFFEEKYKELYLKLLAVGANDSNPTNTKEPIYSLDDFKQKVIRMISEIPDENSRSEFEVIQEVIEKTAPSATIDDVHYWQANEDAIISGVELTPIGHPAREAYKTILDTMTKVPNGWIGFKQNLATRLSMFNNESLRMAMSTPNIDLRKINKEKSAVYIVCKDGDTTFRAILSLFFAFLMMDIKEEYDMEDQKAKAIGVECPALPVYMFLDEMYSVGAIGGLPSKKGEATFMAAQISTVRSRKINMTMLFQSHSQIEEIYGKDAAHTILMNTNCKLFLGGTEIDSTEYFSQLLGDTTVLTESHSETQSFFTTIKSDTENVHTVKARLMTAEEIGKIPKRHILLCHGTDNPVILSSFYYKNHPLYQPDKRVALQSDIVPIRDRIANGEIRKSIQYSIHKDTSAADLFSSRIEVSKKEISNMVNEIPDINVYEKNLSISDDRPTEEIPVIKEENDFSVDEEYLDNLFESIKPKLENNEPVNESVENSSKANSEINTNTENHSESDLANQLKAGLLTVSENKSSAALKKQQKKKKKKNIEIELEKSDLDI